MNTIDRLKALEKAATGGPWETNLSRCDPKRVVSISRKDEHSKPILIPVSDAGVDGELVVEARNALPALLKVADAAKAYHDMANSRYDSSRVAEFERKQDALGEAIAELEAQ